MRPTDSAGYESVWILAFPVLWGLGTGPSEHRAASVLPSSCLLPPTREHAWNSLSRSPLRAEKQNQRVTHGSRPASWARGREGRVEEACAALVVVVASHVRFSSCFRNSC